MKIHVISNPRSGSTYLGHLFDTTLTSSGEYFNEPFLGYNPSDPACVAANVAWTNDWQEIISTLSNTDTFTIKNHLTHLSHLDALGLLDNFRTIEFDRTYMLLRRDVIEVALSLALAHHTNQWAKDLGTAADVVLDTQAVEYAARFIWQNTIELIDNKYKLDVTDTIFYEDLTWDYATDLINLTMDNVGNITKTWDSARHFRPKHQIITNYDLLENHLQTTILEFKHPNVTWVGSKIYLKDKI